MTALPPANSISNWEPNTLSAYNACLDFERNAETDIETMRARILGYLIIHSPSLQARHEVVKVIQSSLQDRDSLSELGQSFLDYFILPCKLSTSLT
jgi:hypothetical protein